MSYKEPLFETLSLFEAEQVSQLEKIFAKKLECSNEISNNNQPVRNYTEEDFSADLLNYINNNIENAVKVIAAFKNFITTPGIALRWGKMVLNPLGISRSLQFIKLGTFQPPNPFKSFGGYTGKKPNVSQVLFYLALRNTEKINKTVSDYKFTEPYALLAEAYHDIHHKQIPERQQRDIHAPQPLDKESQDKLFSHIQTMLISQEAVI